jgi:hypothetical protein
VAENAARIGAGEQLLRELLIMRSSFEHLLHALKKGLALKPKELPISQLFPSFAPASFFESGKWVGPYELLRVPGLGLTWSIEQPEQTMRYLDRDTAAYWSRAGIDWREHSLQNLARRSNPTFGTGGFVREGGPPSAYYALLFMHDDGYGPSRLLFGKWLDQIFPQGYLVALPERSCGIALAADALPEERAKIEDLIGSCYRDGTRPLVPGLHSPALLVPR